MDTRRIGAAPGAAAGREQVQLRDARLCLDCEEVHEEARCPQCASESFAYLSRWVPAPPDSHPPPPPKRPETSVYRRLLVPNPNKPMAYELLKRGAIGLTVLGVARWAWNRNRRNNPE